MFAMRRTPTHALGDAVPSIATRIRCERDEIWTACQTPPVRTGHHADDAPHQGNGPPSAPCHPMMHRCGENSVPLPNTQAKGGGRNPASARVRNSECQARITSAGGVPRTCPPCPARAPIRAPGRGLRCSRPPRPSRARSCPGRPRSGSPRGSSTSGPS